MENQPVPPSDASADDEALLTDDAEADTSPAGQYVSGDDEADRLREENQQLQDKLLRQAAEYQNYRRRSETDRTAAVRRGREDVLLPMLDVFDDLRRSLDAASRAAEGDAESGPVDALAEGVELVYRKFEAALQKLGVEPIEAVGRPFDEGEHEAILQQPAPEGEASGTVLAEVQPGYRVGDRVLRHARVIVAQ